MARRWQLDNLRCYPEEKTFHVHMLNPLIIFKFDKETGQSTSADHLNNMPLISDNLIAEKVE